MTKEETPTLTLDLGLSDKEVFFIGRIVSQWGAIEHEVFVQCLLTFDRTESEEITLPKAMNNLSFSNVLDLWKERVVDTSNEQHRKVLSQQYERIVEVKDYRNALVHGMWSWSPSEPDVITTTRIRKKDIITTKFKADDLVDFYTQIAQIYFNIKFPGGEEQFIEARMSQGGYISRKGFEVLFGNTVGGE